ncbi:hypothetical protein KI387_014536, partial [Taxus chinensis]
QRRWKIGCWKGLSCFGSQKRACRIVPASRTPEGNTSANRTNGVQLAGGANQPTGLNPLLLAPPSSPASFTNSGNPSTVQSPNVFLSLSANVCSPGGPTSTMFATGPYAHETQLVSPPVFSTFTTEPSTAPLTPPPELAHLTTPSSPDVPFAQLLASSLDVKTSNKENGLTFSCSPYTTSGYIATNDLQAAYQLYPGSPASQLVSPKPGVSCSGSPFPDLEFPAHWNASMSVQDNFIPKYEPSKFFNLDMAPSRSFMLSQDSERFGCSKPAELFLDQAPQTCQSRGQQYSSSQETDDYYDNGEHMQHNRHMEPNKQDMEQIEAYRASFGFSADEITTSNREVTEVLGADKSDGIEFTAFDRRSIKAEVQMTNGALFDSENMVLSMDHNGHSLEAQSTANPKHSRQSGGMETDSASETNNCDETDKLENFSRFGEFKFDEKYGTDASSSIIEKWTRYKKKRTAENGLRDYDFFRMKQPQ